MKEDADQIGRIYAAITMKDVDPDFKRVVADHAQRDDEACFVAESDGKVVGFMISYILTAGFGMAKAPGSLPWALIRIAWVRESAPVWLKKYLNITRHRVLKTYIRRCAGIPPICFLFLKPWVLTAAILLI